MILAQTMQWHECSESTSNKQPHLFDTSQGADKLLLKLLEYDEQSVLENG